MLKILLALATILPLSFAFSAAKDKTLNLDTAKSTIEWTGRKAVVKSEHSGTLALKSGTVKIDKNQIIGGDFEIDMKSLDNTDLKGNPKQADLVGHLKSNDFFDVEKYPTAKFAIKAVKALTKATSDATHEVTGDLTLKGETHPVTFPAKINITDKEATALATITIDRTLWNVRYASDKFFKGLGDKVIANDMTVKINLLAK